MASEQKNTHSNTGREASVWQKIRRNYRRANGAAWNLPSYFLKLTLVAYFIFCAFVLSLRFYVLPNIAQYKSDIEQIASRALGKPITIASIDASWDGLRPHLELNNVVLRDRKGQRALTLPRISATVAWQSIPAFDLRLHKLDLYQPELNIERDADGKLYIAGLLFSPSAERGSPSADWFFRQHNITIHNGRLRWADNQRQAPDLLLERINLVVKNGWRHHRLRLNAVPPAALAAPIELRGDFDHPYFADSISDVLQWTGELYADLKDTSLDTWKPYLDLPLEIQGGFGSLRTWLSLDHAQLTAVTADVQLSDISIQLRKDLPQLNLLNAKGRFSVKADIDLKNAQSASLWTEVNHSIALSNFSMKTKEGLVLPETSFSNAYVPAHDNEAEIHVLSAQQLDLGALSKFTQFLPLSADQHQMLTDSDPSGRLKNFSAEWQGKYPNIYAYNAAGQFENLSLKAQPPRLSVPAKGGAPAQPHIPGIPGFKNLSGNIKANQKGGSIFLDANYLVLQLPGYFENPAKDFDAFRMHANWLLSENKPFHFQINHFAFERQGFKGSVEGSIKLPLKREPGKLVGEANISGTLSNFDIKTIGYYLPLQMPEFTRKWLTSALEDGTVPNGSFLIKGNMADFPFVAENGKKPKGKFNLALEIDNGKLNYMPGFYGRDGISPMWPQAEDINGTLTINNAHMEIFGKTAKTTNVDLKNVLAVIPNLNSRDPILKIHGTAVGAMPDFIRYTRISPVATWINDFTEDTKTDGTGKLSLSFQMPLNHAIDTEVQGALEFQGNKVKLIRDLPVLSQTKGIVGFNEKGFKLNNIEAQFLGGSVVVSGGTQKNKRFRVHAQGKLTANGLRKAYPGMTDRIRGIANYKVVIDENGRQPYVTFKSNLRGLILDFPAPAKKAAKEVWPLTFRASALRSRLRSTMLDQFRISVGSDMEAHYVRKRSTKKYAPWRVIRGGIGVNTAAPKPEQGLAMNVVTRSLDIDAWDDALSPSENSKTVDKKASKENAFMQYIDPTFFTAHANKLNVAGLQLDDAIVKAEYRENKWQAQVDSTQAEGQVSWQDLETDQGRVTARLNRLTIQKSNVDEVGMVLTSEKAPKQVPTLDIQTKKLDLFGKPWGAVGLIANYTPTKDGAKWSFDKLTIRNPDFALTSNGNWHTKSGADVTHVNYKLDVSDAGKMLERVGYSGVLRDGEGTLEGKLQWRDNPFSFDKSSLTGNFNLNMEDGQFLKVEPGAARLLSVLSLQSLPKRLMLDFRDIFSSGFAFDSLTANTSVKNGQLSTENFKMRGLNASIFMEGIADLEKETQNLHVLVVPEVNAAGASVIYGLAVNPIVGLGTFLAQLILRDPVRKVLTYEYQITGTWDEPIITEIKRKPGDAKRKPATKTKSKE